jgi:hypothetical protein
LLGEEETMPTITQERLTTMTRTVQEEYASHLDKLKKTKDRQFGLTPKQLGDMLAGHEDGMRNLIMALRCAGVITVETVEG